MSRRPILITALVAAVAVVTAAAIPRVGVAQEPGGVAVAPRTEAPATERTAPAEPPAPASRGEYLVHHVAMCVQCHTPRTADGELDRSRLLRGAPVPLTSPFANREWALAAPSLAGLAPWTEEQIVHLLTTGVRPGGEAPKPPMPPFRLSRADAEAVVDYLKSVR